MKWICSQHGEWSEDCNVEDFAFRCPKCETSSMIHNMFSTAFRACIVLVHTAWYQLDRNPDIVEINGRPKIKLPKDITLLEGCRDDPDDQDYCTVLPAHGRKFCLVMAGSGGLDLCYMAKLNRLPAIMTNAAVPGLVGPQEALLILG